MVRTTYRPSVIALGFALGLLASASACALLTRAAPAASLALPAQPAIDAPAAERDPFMPLVEVP